MRTLSSPSGATVCVDGRSVLSFAGCSYLGLGSNAALLQAGAQALLDQGATAQLARHYGMQSPANMAVEEEACRFFGTAGAMYFSAGYLFPLIAFAGLADDYDVAILDATAHYCLFEGARAAGKDIRTFAHCDPDDLERVVASCVAAGKRFCVGTDGMFPTFGRIAPLADYRRIIAPHGAWLVVDESHSFGAVGATGCGAVEACGVGRDRVLAGGSLSKGFGAFGGIAIADAQVIERLWQTPAARGASAGLSAGAAMSAASMRHIRAHPDILVRRDRNAKVLRSTLRDLGFAIDGSGGPVVAFAHGSAAHMRSAQQAMFDDGVLILYSTYVGAGPDGVLRIASFADHEPAHFARLAACLQTHVLQFSGASTYA